MIGILVTCLAQHREGSVCILPKYGAPLHTHTRTHTRDTHTCERAHCNCKPGCRPDTMDGVSSSAGMAAVRELIGDIVSAGSVAGSSASPRSEESGHAGARVSSSFAPVPPPRPLTGVSPSLQLAAASGDAGLAFDFALRMRRRLSIVELRVCGRWQRGCGLLPRGHAAARRLAIASGRGRGLGGARGYAARLRSTCA